MFKLTNLKEKHGCSPFFFHWSNRATYFSFYIVAWVSLFWLLDRLGEERWNMKGKIPPSTFQINKVLILVRYMHCPQSDPINLLKDIGQPWTIKLMRAPQVVKREKIKMKCRLKSTGGEHANGGCRQRRNHQSVCHLAFRQQVCFKRRLDIIAI